MGFVLSQAILEIRYRRGMVFLDKCGSTMNALEDALEGHNLVGSVPSMQYGELSSPTDRLTVRYGPKTMLAMQHWVDRPVRIEVVAPKAWEVVSNALDVRRHVTRAGFRLIFQWPFADAKRGVDVFKRAGLIEHTPGWASLFGAPDFMSCASVSGFRRTELNILHQEVGEGTPAEIRDLIAPAAIQLDIDTAHPSCPKPFGITTDEQAFSMGPGQLKDFLGDSWERARDIANQLDGLIQRGSHE